jgi:hypothetical protein
MPVQANWAIAAIDAITAARDAGSGTIYAATDIQAQLITGALAKTHSEALRSGKIKVVTDSCIDNPYFELG